MIMIEEMSVLLGMVDLGLVAAMSWRAGVAKYANCRALYGSEGRAQGGSEICRKAPQLTTVF
jgi:hypothetical protein